MPFQVKAYFKFLWKSTNEHGVHSPFVFDLVTKCFYDKKKYPEYSTLKRYRESLLQNRNTIEVTDFGAGSRVFKSNKREIAKIAKTAGITPKRAELLFRIVKYFKPDSVLEIGTSLGLATSALSLGTRAEGELSGVHPSAKIITLEGCPETSKTAQLQFHDFGLNNIQPIVTEFEAYLKSPYPQPCNLNPVTPTLIYFDGNHQKRATLEYSNVLLQTVTNDSIWIFDDIHWSTEMEEAWETIKKNPKVTVTIDTFQWGLVFFRKEQEKEHFVIRC
jgi:predicted O-methyltransferase YrrM